MGIRVACARCGKGFTADLKHGGKRFACKGCGDHLRMPRMASIGRILMSHPATPHRAAVSVTPSAQRWSRRAVPWLASTLVVMVVFSGGLIFRSNRSTQRVGASIALAKVNPVDHGQLTPVPQAEPSVTNPIAVEALRRTLNAEPAAADPGDDAVDFPDFPPLDDDVDIGNDFAVLPQIPLDAPVVVLQATVKPAPAPPIAVKPLILKQISPSAAPAVKAPAKAAPKPKETVPVRAQTTQSVSQSVPVYQPRPTYVPMYRPMPVHPMVSVRMYYYR